MVNKNVIDDDYCLDDDDNSDEDQETVPLAHDGIFKDHGSVQKRALTSHKNLLDGELIEKQIPKFNRKIAGENKPMSLGRKLAFFMSFNVWILYFFAFLWLIPCRENTDCWTPIKEWSFLLENAELTSYSGSDSFKPRTGDNVILLGYTESPGTGGKVAAIDTITGNISWTASVNFVPRSMLSVDDIASSNGNRVLIIGRREMSLLNMSQGNEIWNRKFDTEESAPSVSPVLTYCAPKNLRLIYVRSFRDNVYMSVLDVATGRETSYFGLPSGTKIHAGFELRNVGNRSEPVIICRLQESNGLFVIPIPMEAICRENQVPISTNFSQMISIKNKANSDYLQSQSSILEDAVVLGWKKQIVTISFDKHRRRPFEKWRKEFRYDSNVRHFSLGHFSSSGEEEVAVAIEDGNSTLTVVVLKLADGEEVATYAMSERELIEKFVSVRRDLSGIRTDVIIVGSKPRWNTTPTTSVQYPSHVSYTLIRFDKLPATGRDLFNLTYGGPFKVGLGSHRGLILAESNDKNFWNISRRELVIDEAIWCSR